jgi:nicotinamidase/pyrazinamidase
MDLTLQETDVLLIIDLQNDFCPGGALAVHEGHAIVPTVNALAQKFLHIIVTQDWHPPRHISFASTHGRQHFEEIQVNYGPQTLWPEHCIQNSEGAEFHRDLELDQAELILRKGFRPGVDSYSAFLENDHLTPTGLAGYLRERGLKRLFLCGLAYDYCVRYSAVDGKHLGFEPVVIEDASRPVNLPGTVDSANATFADHHIPRIEAASLLGQAWIR